MLDIVCYGAWVAVIAYGAYSLGLVIGYKRGLAYGMKGLEDYHQHAMKAIGGFGAHVTKGIKDLGTY